MRNLFLREGFHFQCVQKNVMVLQVFSRMHSTPWVTGDAILRAAIVIVLRALHLMEHATPMSTFSIMCTPTEEVIIQNTEFTFTFTSSYMCTSFLSGHSQIITYVIYMGRPDKIT